MRWFCQHKWREIGAHGLMGLFSPITWHEMEFECVKCHKKRKVTCEASSDDYNMLKDKLVSSKTLRELHNGKLLKHPIRIRVPVIKLSFRYVSIRRYF